MRMHNPPHAGEIIKTLCLAESWLNQQTQYDLWRAERRRKQLRVAKLQPGLGPPR